MVALPSLVRPMCCVMVLVAAASGCTKQPATQANGGTTTSGPSAVPTRILAFSVSNENLHVDKVGLGDSLMKPDGARDLAFTATVDGPFDAIFLVSTNAKGEPTYGLRADTLTGNEDIPTELGGVIDTGKMTVGILIVEGGRVINGDRAAVHVGPGNHALTMYAPNTATLHAGGFVRMYVRVPGGALLPGPIAPY